MHNLLEYSEIYSKTSGSSWQYSRDELALNNNDFIFDFPGNDNKSNSLKFKPKTTRRTNNDEIMVPLRYLRYFWRTLQMPLINSEVSLMLTQSKIVFLITDAVGNQNPTSAVTDTKLYVPVVTLSTVKL